MGPAKAKKKPSEQWRSALPLLKELVRPRRKLLAFGLFLTIAHDHGYEVRVAEVTRSDLYIAEEMFVCGTAAEVSAVNSVDDRAIPCPGPMTETIAAEFAKAVRGEIDKYKDWCELV